jgi:hypothetical protein
MHHSQQLIEAMSLSQSLLPLTLTLPIDLKVSNSIAANVDPVVERNAVKWSLNRENTTAARVIASRERLRLSV